ncbi:MAG: HAD-IIB family hydrolase [Hoeflea sp.]|uniref:HAD-IIB family hydrolase n=1 Tax=Hoeflea sp. TaxID=1940281 RepID=UPI0032EAC322
MPLDHELTPARGVPPDPGRLIVFSDLDGTLLDHETYSHAAAAEALAGLRETGVPLILASSKTAAEIAPLRAELGFPHCEAIVENGAGILEPHESGDEASGTHDRLLSTIAGLPPELTAQFRGFSNWTDAEVSARTGLSTEQAARARKRQFSEPGLWSGSNAELDRFRELLDAEGIRAQQGGRFMTLSFDSDKALRMTEIIDRYRNSRHEPFALALGDAGNDIGMLEAAALGVIIPNSGHGGIPRLAGEANGQIIRETLEGPAGWNNAVLQMLQIQNRLRES